MIVGLTININLQLNRDMQRVSDIRQKFIDAYRNNNFVIDKSGVKTVELLGECFLADEDWIIREPDHAYILREITWYKRQSLSIEDIPGKIPQIWQSIASTDNKINSNYGYLVLSRGNYNQYQNVLKELQQSPNSRRATMIYNRPSMHYDFNTNGMNDFICTYANGFFIRDNKLISHFIMRSNDVVFGYCNDVAWARWIQRQLAADLNIEVGDLVWFASSLHLYERHFNHVEKLISS